MRISDWSSDVCSSDLDVAAVAHLLVARAAFIELVGDELARGIGLHLGLEAPRRLVIERDVAPDVAAFEQRGAHRDVGLGLAHHKSEEHTSELQSLMRISYAVFCLKNKKKKTYRLYL